MEDHHVDRPEVEAGQPAQLTGTNRSIGLIAGASFAKRHGGTRCNIVAPRRQAQAAAPKAMFCRVPSPRPAPKPCRQDRGAARPRPKTLLPVTSPICGALGRPGGHSEGPNTRSHPELGRENPLRQWYCTPRCGRVGRRQARKPPSLSPSNPVSRLNAALAEKLAVNAIGEF